MTKFVFAILLAAAGSFAGTWTTAAPITQILYLQGAGPDQGKTILQIVQNGTSYYTKSDNPNYAKILEVVEGSLVGAKRIQLYFNDITVPFSYMGGQYLDYNNPAGGFVNSIAVTSSVKPFYAVSRLP